MANDTAWHTVIVDMGQSVSDDGKVYFADESAAKFIGFRPFYQTSSADAYMDFAYIKWAATKDNAAALVSEEENVDFGYYSGGKWNKLDLAE